MNHYDDDQFFRAYIQYRNSKFCLNEQLEIPAMLGRMPDLMGKEVLDLGCGFGRYCSTAIQLGARRIVGVDVSKRMCQLARNTVAGSHVEIIEGDINQLQLPNQKFDVVVSSLVLHYVEDLGKVLNLVSSLLKPNGIFVYTVNHPIFTANLSVDDSLETSSYAVEGVREHSFLGKKLTKFHRTISTNFRCVRENRLLIDHFEELYPNNRTLTNDKNVKAYSPVFMLIESRLDLNG